jgi:prepilin-type N-terminal cleavage/methylation domain-containing protein
MHRGRLQFGFSLIELMVTMAILLIISAAVFGLLNVAQIRYRNEQQFLDSFQNARVGIEQLTREIHSAGTPPPSTYDAAHVPAIPTTATPDMQHKFAMSFRGYDTLTFAYDMGCAVGTNCYAPGPWALSMEMDLDPYNTNCPNWVEVVEYNLNDDPQINGVSYTSTLMRSVSSKLVAGGTAPGPLCEPAETTWANKTWVPFIENVVNKFPAANGIVTNPPGTPIPLFTVGCDVLMSCGVQNVNQVYINMWVRSKNIDLQTNQTKVIQLQSTVQRLSPDQ